jgi:hypothetical protein
VSVDLDCHSVRPELSARLDGEHDPSLGPLIDVHVRTCRNCRSHAARVEQARKAVRLQRADLVPDLSEGILAEVASRGARARRRDDLMSWLRIGAVAALVGALVVLASSLPFTDSQPSSAAAGEIVARVRAAARSLGTYRATYRIVERNFAPEVPRRTFLARVWFSAPERFRLQVRDLTAYPGPEWTSNDVDLFATPHRWWIEEPTSCPAELGGRCPYNGEREIRSVVARQPFDGTTALPTDAVVPLETLATSDGFSVLGRRRIAGRPADLVTLPLRRAVPLVTALQPGGAWRSFYPQDRVEIWVDSETLFPLRVDVLTSEGSGRRAWSRENGYRDEPGELLLQIRASSFEDPSLSPRDFMPPETLGVARNGGFDGQLRPESLDWMTPTELFGLRTYRAGAVGHSHVTAYERGMTWLKVTGERANSDYPTFAEEVSLDGGGVGYYQPANGLLKRSIDLFGKNRHVRVESNLARDRMLAVASSIPMRARTLPEVIESGRGLSVRRLEPGSAERIAFAQMPRFLPSGYEQSAALLSRSGANRTLTILYRQPEAEYGGDGIRITASPQVKVLPPTAEDTVGVRLGSLEGRWLPQRGELEWIKSGIYHSVAVPSGDLVTALRVAGSLR